MKWLRMLLGAVVYFSAASFIALAVGISVLWGKGALDGAKTVDLMAAIYGLDLAEMRSQIVAAQQDDTQIQIAYNKVLAARTKASLDIDLRESAIDKSMGELHNLQNNVVIQRERHNQVVQSFEQRLRSEQQDRDDARLDQVRQLIENMRPKQAKEHLMLLVKDDGLRDVVMILGAMADDKQKKVIAEFKSADEQDVLNDLIDEIRNGAADAKLLNATRNQLEEVKSKTP